MGNKRFEYLCRPGKIGPVELKNRMTLAPNGTGFGGTNGAITDRDIDYYEERAKGGAGLIIVECTLVVPAAKYGNATPFEREIWDRNLVPGWKRLTDAIHFWGAKAGVQINWQGIGIVPELCPGIQPTAPSAVEVPGFITPVISRELPIEEIMWLEDQYALGATCAKEAGFDIVQVHCVHGYGIAGFNSEWVNRRNDLYGGSFENRMRFGLNILKKVRAVLTPDMAMTVRIPADEFVHPGNGKEECLRIAQTYEAAGVDAIHLSCGAVGSIHHTIQPFYYPRVYLEPYLADMRKAVKVPLGVAGSLNNPDDAERILRDYGFDYADLGRVLFADPEYPNKVMEERPEDIRRCLRCCECIHALIENHTAVECAVNPEMGREARFKITPAEKPKEVLVVGGGPGGMEAARVAALRGHSVTLCEKNDKLGGNLIPASVPDFKVEFRWLIDWLARQLDKLGVKVQLGKAVTPDEVAKLKPDVVIVATGAESDIPDDIVGINKGVTAIDVLLGKAKVGDQVIIAGGQEVGCETALYLAQKGKKVMIVKRRTEDIATDMDLVVNRKVLLEKLEEHKVTWMTGIRVTEIDGKGIKAINAASGESVSYPADTVVLALGLKPVNGLVEALKDKVPEVYAIGDCVKARMAKDAIYEGSIIARRI